MASKYTLNVSVTERLHGFVAAQVASGRFFTASEVVRAALRELERRLEGDAAQGENDNEIPRRALPKDRS